jgi:hypothetical protein
MAVFGMPVFHCGNLAFLIAVFMMMLLEYIAVDHRHTPI